MKHPTLENVQKVIDNLKSVAHLAKNALDMGQVQVQTSQYTCGTIHCVGGWYAVALKDKNDEIAHKINKNLCYFDDGIDAMAKDLGFLHRALFQAWAIKNPKIWGNSYGGSLSADPLAYNHDPEKGLQWSDIIRHWENVKENLERAQDEN